jgi:hypothetical protein
MTSLKLILVALLSLLLVVCSGSDDPSPGATATDVSTTDALSDGSVDRDADSGSGGDDLDAGESDPDQAMDPETTDDRGEADTDRSESQDGNGEPVEEIGESLDLIDGGDGSDAMADPDLSSDPDVTADPDVTSDPDIDDGFTITGTTDGEPPEGSQVIAAWFRYSFSPDGLYKWGEAPIDGGTFSMTFSEPPPAGAINADGVSVALFILLSPDSSISDGVMEESDLATALGHSTVYAVIHMQSDASRVSWHGDFSAGYSCGEGMPHPDGTSKDIYVPVDCSEFVISLGSLETLETVGFF